MPQQIQDGEFQTQDPFHVVLGNFTRLSDELAVTIDSKMQEGDFIDVKIHLSLVW